MPEKIKYSDVDFSFSKNSFSDDVNIKTNENSIKQSIKNIILTHKQERPFKSRMGSNLADILFELYDQGSHYSLNSEIRDQLEIFEPRVLLQKVRIDDSLIDQHILSFEIIFKYIIGNPKEPVQDSLVLSIERVR
jgi:phage baseplate assembly protein W